MAWGDPPETCCGSLPAQLRVEGAMALELADLEFIEDMINQKIDSEILVLRQDLGEQLSDLQDAIQSLMQSVEELRMGMALK
jgi:hypothetical protein